MTRDEKIKVASETRAKINKDMGVGTVMSLSESPDMDIETVSTGSLGLDVALGVGGLPYGRIVEIYGPESSGKTTIAIHAIAEAQKNGGLCAIIDAEHAFDKEYAQKLGVDIEALDINQPDYGEQGLEVAEKLISCGAFSVVVIDSVAALVPKAELDDEMGANKMGLQARMMGQALRKLVGMTKKTNTLVIFINQLRDRIGVLYGNPETTTGGNALKFYASVRLDVRRSTTADNSIVKNGEITGNLTRVKVIKNKVAPPFAKCEFDILYGQGIDKIGELIKLGGDLDILKKWGKTITYPVGGDKYEVSDFYNMLQNNPEFYDQIRGEILNKVGIKTK